MRFNMASSSSSNVVARGRAYTPPKLRSRSPASRRAPPSQKDLPDSHRTPTLGIISCPHYQITSLRGLEVGNALQYLYIQNNYLTNLEYLRVQTALKELHAESNQITSVEGLMAQPKLSAIVLKDNPICKEKEYRLMVLLACGSSLRRLDGVPISTFERARASSFGDAAAEAVRFGYILQEEEPKSEEEYRSIIADLKSQGRGESFKFYDAERTAVSHQVADSSVRTSAAMRASAPINSGNTRLTNLFESHRALQEELEELRKKTTERESELTEKLEACEQVIDILKKDKVSTLALSRLNAQIEEEKMDALKVENAGLSEENAALKLEIMSLQSEKLARENELQAENELLREELEKAAVAADHVAIDRADVREREEQTETETEMSPEVATVNAPVNVEEEEVRVEEGEKSEKNEKNEKQEESDMNADVAAAEAGTDNSGKEVSSHEIVVAVQPEEEKESSPSNDTKLDEGGAEGANSGSRRNSTVGTQSDPEKEKEKLSRSSSVDQETSEHIADVVAEKVVSKKFLKEQQKQREKEEKEAEKRAAAAVKKMKENVKKGKGKKKK